MLLIIRQSLLKRLDTAMTKGYTHTTQHTAQHSTAQANLAFFQQLLISDKDSTDAD